MKEEETNQGERASELAELLKGLSAEERASFLESHRSEGPGILAEVERLLREGPAHASLWESDVRDVRDESGRHSKAASALKPNDTLADYSLIRCIGEGGMGQVWEARHRSLGRLVALKVMRTSRIGKKGTQLFEREARAGGRLVHPGIVSVYESGKSDGVFWIAQELVNDGTTLRDSIDRMRAQDLVKPGHYRRVAEFLAQLADALEAAHSAGVIHRDLKPRNVLITKDGKPKLTDFGLARIVDEAALSISGEIAGTWLYMSPEQVAARRMGIDHRTDIFSLGIVMYEMLSLIRPFEGDTSHQVAEKILTWDPPDLRRLRSRIPTDLAVICAKALEKRRDDRYQSMQELADDLRRFLANQPIHAQPPGALKRAQKWILRHPARSVALGISGVAFVAITTLAVRMSAINSELIDSLGREAAATEEKNQIAGLRLRDYVFDSAEKLWPVTPDSVAELESLIREAEDLRANQDQLLTKRSEIRATALQLSPEEKRLEVEAHPLYAELTTLEAELAWRENFRSWLNQSEEPQLREPDWSEYPDEFQSLVRNANRFVAENRTVFGQEETGWAIAERALQVAPEEEQAIAMRSLSDALFATGQLELALDTIEDALNLADPDDWSEYEEYRDNLKERVAEHSGSDASEGFDRETEDLRARCAALREIVNTRRTWRFAQGDSSNAFWEALISELLDDIDLLFDPETGIVGDGIDPVHGWGLRRRLALAKRLEQEHAEGGEFHRRWGAALSSIRAAYPGIEIAEIPGLVPLAADPVSGLWEFWHVPSGNEPRRYRAGELQVDEGTGMVFILIGPSEFLMGAQADDPDSPQYHEHCEESEEPPHRVQLGAFLISKYEVSQAQWIAMTGTNPSFYDEPLSYANITHDLTHPVERVSWFECVRVLSRFGLTLPSEAQWELAARGGTTTAWWFGDERESLLESDAINIADESAALGGALWPGISELPGFDDGYVVHAPVDEFSPNGFGLFNVHGNVMEWCIDEYDEEFYSRSPDKDPVSWTSDSEAKSLRGGAFSDNATAARSAARGRNSPDAEVYTIGVRPCIPLK